MIEKFKENYEKAVNDYVNRFAEKYELDFDGWVGNEVGGIAEFGDYTFNFEDVKLYLESKLKDLSYFLDWFDFTLNYYEKCNINLKSYIKLRQDYEYLKGFGFKLDEFEKHLLYMRIKN